MNETHRSESEETSGLDVLALILGGLTGLLSGGPIAMTGLVWLFPDLPALPMIVPLFLALVMAVVLGVIGSIVSLVSGAIAGTLGRLLAVLAIAVGGGYCVYESFGMWVKLMV